MNTTIPNTDGSDLPADAQAEIAAAQKRASDASAAAQAQVASSMKASSSIMANLGIDMSQYTKQITDFATSYNTNSVNDTDTEVANSSTSSVAESDALSAVTESMFSADGEAEADVDVKDIFTDEGSNLTQGSELIVDEKSNLTHTQLWMIATGADLSMLNGQCQNTLSTGLDKATCKLVLERDWDIQNRAQLIEMIDSLNNPNSYTPTEFDNCRKLVQAILKSSIDKNALKNYVDESTQKLWDELQNALSHRSTIIERLVDIVSENYDIEIDADVEHCSEFNKAMSIDSPLYSVTDPENVTNKLHALHDELSMLIDIEDNETVQTGLLVFRDMIAHGEWAPDRSIKLGVAWNICRTVNLARWGFDAGFLNEAETWKFLERAKSKMQPVYDSWTEMSLMYEVGRVLWSGELDSEHTTMRMNRKILLTDPRSPWVTIPWDTDMAI